MNIHMNGKEEQKKLVLDWDSQGKEGILETMLLQ